MTEIAAQRPESAGTDVSELCPEATHLMALLGEPVDDDYLTAFERRYGVPWLRRLTTPSPSVRNFWATSDVVARRTHWELLELLLLEHWICEEPRAIAQLMSSDRSFPSELVNLRGRVALALYSRAKSVNWQEPLTFVRALRVSELYLRSVLDHQHLLRPKAVVQYTGRLGVALVLQARYIDLGADAAREMVEHIRDSIARGNTKVDAFVYLAEALLRLHDATGDAGALSQLVDLETSGRVPEQSDLLDSHVAEAWFRLSQEASTQAGVEKCRSRAVARCLALERSVEPLVQCRLAIVRAFLETTPSEQATEHTLRIRGLRTPFGVKSQVRIWMKQDRSQTLRLLRAVDSQLSSGGNPVIHSRIHRSLSASIKSEIAALLEGLAWRDQRLSYLSAAVELRGGRGSGAALKDPESRLENALDRFDMFRFTGQRHLLLSAIVDILSLIQFDQAWPTPLLVLARELDAMEGPLPMQVAYELNKFDAGSARGVMAHVLANDVAAIYSLAAARALASREVDRKHLGGRSGVYLAEDYSGIVSETFVFKPTTKVLAEREATRVTSLERRLAQMGLESRFSVPATLARSELPVDDLLRRRGYDVLVARQFHFGTILPDALVGADLAMRTSVLDSVVHFLAVIHSSESVGVPGQGMRRDLFKKEFGRWLRSGLQMQDWSERFEQWWSIFGDTPRPLVRRDAHPLNWLVTPGRTIVAVDFEACGWRPAGYELAQLLDDRPLLPVDSVGWKARLHLVKQYRRSMDRCGARIEHNRLVRAWEASTVARAVGALTSPNSDPATRQHGELLLSWLASNSEHQSVRDLAAVCNHAWSVRRGVMTVQDDSRTISDARRRHLSRAMAFELRHGSSVLLDRGGWAYLASVSDALNRSGLHTSSAELSTVAGSIDEPRFEVAGKRVRARYGHTREVEILYDEAGLPPTLYHGTASSNLDAIFSRGEGLRAMGRRWVHLSSDPKMALRTAERHGPGVLLALDAESHPAQIFHAGGTVYLTAEVQASALRIVSPAELFLTAVPDSAYALP